jgi:hypothetical protein
MIETWTLQSTVYKFYVYTYNCADCVLKMFVELVSCAAGGRVPLEIVAEAVDSIRDTARYRTHTLTSRAVMNSIIVFSGVGDP